jgi:hypothetical protein
MALLPTPILDYTDKDFDSMRVRLISLIRQAFPDWTDFNVANFGNILLEAYAFVLDVTGKYQDNQAAEAFLVKATQRKNLIALAKQIGFVPANAFAATADVTFTLGAVPANDVVIPEGTLVRTTDVTGAVEFRLLEDLTILAATNPPIGIGTVENSELVQDLFASNSLPNQEFSLSASPFLEIEALAATNGIYTQADNFLRSRPEDRHFVVIVDQNDRARVRFGNGVNGEIPVGTITVDFKTGGGSVGNVEAGDIDRIEGTFVDVLLNPVTVTVTNATQASGGLNRQSNESIRIQAPESLRVLTRTVAREDYEIAAETKISGVARALMLTADQDLSFDENSGTLFIIPQGGGTPTQTLLDEVAAIFTTRFEDGGLPKTVTFNLTTAGAVYKTINVFAVVYLHQGASPAGTRADIEDALERFFAVLNEDGSKNTEVDFGFNLKDVDGNPVGEIAHSRVFDQITAQPGVRKLGDSLTEATLNGLHQDVTILLREFPQLGTVTLIDGDTGQPLPTS